MQLSILQMTSLGFLLWLTMIQTAQSLEPRELLQRAKVTPPDRVAFRELRYNSLLKEPMELSGYLEYPERGQLRKVVESPFNESMLVVGDQVEIKRDGQTRRLSLKNRRSVLVILQSIESLLAGNLESLERHFLLELTGTTESWRFELTPNSERLARQLRSLTVFGEGDNINLIRFDMQNGEWQLLQILHHPTEP